MGVGVEKNGCSQSGDRTLKLKVFELLTDGINWIFACWYRFAKIKNWLKIFGVGMVKNGCGQYGHHRTHESWLYLKNEQMK